MAVVGIADAHVGTRAGTVTTYALGSCVGVVLYDPVVRVGALLHAMLPSKSIAPDKAAAQPWMFLDVGVPRLFRDCYARGAVKERLIVKAAGGARIQTTTSGEDHFQIGKRNIAMLKTLLQKNSVLLKAEDLGGTLSRTLSLDLSTGIVLVKSLDGEREL